MASALLWGWKRALSNQYSTTTHGLLRRTFRRPSMPTQRTKSGRQPEWSSPKQTHLRLPLVVPPKVSEPDAQPPSQVYNMKSTSRSCVSSSDQPKGWSVLLFWIPEKPPRELTQDTLSCKATSYKYIYIYIHSAYIYIYIFLVILLKYSWFTKSH